MDILTETLPNFSPARVRGLEAFLAKATDCRRDLERVARLVAALEALPLPRLTATERRSLANLLARGLGYRGSVPCDPASLRALIVELREALAEAGQACGSVSDVAES